MEIRYSLTADDLAHLRHRDRPWLHRGLVVLLILISLQSGKMLFFLAQNPDADWRMGFLLATIALFALAALCLRLWQQQRPPPRNFGPYTLTLTAAGIALTTPHAPRFFAWPELIACVEHGDYDLRYFQDQTCHIVPHGVSPEPFAAAVRSYWRNYPDHQNRELPDRPRRLNGLWVNLGIGYRLAVFRPFNEHAAVVSGAELGWLIVMGLLLTMAMNYLTALPTPSFNRYGLIYLSAHIVVFLLSGLMVAGLTRNTRHTLRLLILLAAAEWMTALIYGIISNLAARLGADNLPPHWGWSLFLIWLAWNFTIVLRVTGRVYRQPAPAALVLTSAYVFCNWGIGFYLPQPEFFYQEEPPEPEAEAPDIDGEEVLYQQSRLLQEATAKLAKERRGVTDLYFIGFAGQADEQVFAHEVSYAKDLFDRRFDTQGRSIALVNSFNTAETLPIANAHNLEMALEAVAKRMNRAEDVLFLFLTSHGSKDHQLSVSFYPLPLNDLPAAKLKQLLDHSGIQHRVIVVSACYSGGFLDALKDEHSLILTAASRDHTSFGCGVESKFTYFGEAYFVDALTKTGSFVTAFTQAEQAIAAREKREHITPSQPQAHIGTAILPKLRELERRFDQ